MTKYIHILNFKADKVASSEEAREVAVRLMIQNIAHTSKHTMIAVSDEPININDSINIKSPYTEGEVKEDGI